MIASLYQRLLLDAVCLMAMYRNLSCQFNKISCPGEELAVSSWQFPVGSWQSGYVLFLVTQNLAIISWQLAISKIDAFK